MICLDTCGTAGDTVCQEGGRGAFGSMCEFGTDCSDCGSRLLPLPDVGIKATNSDSVATQDVGPGLAIGLALGPLAIGLALGGLACIWYRKRRMQTPILGSSTRAPQQVEVTMAHPGFQKV